MSSKSQKVKPSVWFDTPSLLDFELQESPFYTDDHRRYQLHIRDWCDRVMAPYKAKFEKWAVDEHVPKEEVIKIAKMSVKHGGVRLFPVGLADWDGIEWDPFFLIIALLEVERTGFSYASGIFAIAIPPLARYGKNPVHKRVLQQVRDGETCISLAVSEPKGGSNVAEIETKATLTEDGKHYIVNGSKYWITGGHRADWFVTLVRTSPKNRFGVTLILIPRTKGVFTNKMKLQGSNANDTAIVTFANVKVPVENVIGAVDQGFIPLMQNFNMERFMMCVGMIAQSRLCILEATQWARERETFGKPLIKSQVIQHKIAEMSRKTLAAFAFLERVAYQMKMDPRGTKDPSLPRNIALLKVQCSKLLQEVTVECSQILGGRSYVKGGRGGVIERIYRTVRALAISGGSEEILLDFAVRQGISKL